jgi:GxxExxY protein
MDIDDVTHGVIGAAIAVHRELGPGLLESAYESALAIELTHRGLKADRQRVVAATYRGVPLDCAYRLDMVVEERVVVELKTVSRFEPIHVAQLLTYLRLTGCQVGLLVNFNTSVMKQGIRRVVLGLPEGRRPTPRSSASPR